MNILKLAVCAGFAVVTLQSPAFSQSLKEDQVRSLIIGKTLHFVSTDGVHKGVAKHGKNGKSSLSMQAPKKFKDKGSWRMEGNKLCATWGIVRDGKEACTDFKKTTKPDTYKIDTGFVLVR